MQFSFGQQPKMLKTSDFSGQTVSQQWVYVKLKPGREDSQIQNLSKSTANNIRQTSISNLIKVQVPEGVDPIQYCNQLRKSSAIFYADPIVEYFPLATTNDPLTSNQYYLDVIRAYDAWNITTGDDDITIGIIDTGIDTDHEDIVNNLWVNTADPIDGEDNDGNGYVDDYLGYDFADNDNDPNVENGNHGMIVGGIAGASTNNGKGIAGVGYNTKVAALKGFRTSDNYGSSTSLYGAIEYAADMGFDVINLSWGRMGIPLQSEQDIINYAVLEKNVVVVAAAGNEGGKSTEQNKFYPASYENVLSVGASDGSDNKSSGSTFNYSVDLIAPGVSMYSTIKNDGYTNGGPGTSYAAPQVAAAAALVKDVFPGLSALQIMERVRSTTDDIYDVGNNSDYEGKLGKGRLNVLRAVSETNVKSLRAESPTLTSSFGETVFFGDTVKVSALLTNYLSAINNPTVTISSPNNDFIISQGSFQPGYLNTLDTKNISFEVILNKDIAPETTIGIRFDYSGSSYNDFQYLDVTTSPDYADFGNDVLSMTISGDGDLGFNEYGPNFEGSGFRYNLDTLMTYTGLMLATNGSSVSDNIITSYSNQSRNQDFNVQKNYKLYHHPGADHFGYSEFNDLNRAVLVEQSNITWVDEDFLIIRYRLVNTSASAINNLSVGIFADWDLDDETTNYAEYNGTNHYIFARNSTSDLFAGVQVLGGDNPEFSAIDMGAHNGNSQDVNDLFNDATKYDYLVNQDKLTAGGVGAGNDVATINGVTITQLNAYSEEYVNVIYAVANSQSNLELAFQDASSRLDDFLQKPRVLETFYTCDGFSVEINPSAGTQYEFYEDPLGQTQIGGVAESINVSTSQDTTFYVKNVDQNYPSDIFEVRLNLLNEIANFEMSTDTLYLDHPTTNVVQFTDKSLNAISWNWDFDQGTLASIQHPSLSFSTPGTYTISLMIENEQGCMDTFEKDLVVANRPTAPSFPGASICPGDDVTISEPSAEKIYLYAFRNQSEPSLGGQDLLIESIQRDTIIYVSGVYGSFESKKVAYHIDVMEVSGKVLVAPDTLSADHNLTFSANDLAEGSTLEWFIDGVSAGTSASLTIPATNGLINAELEITSNNNCIRRITKTFFVSSSPFASHTDIVSCSGGEVEILPQSGDFFGFYEDPDLTTLIKKGKSLKTADYSKVYVVSLEDGLPGMPIEVNITVETPEIEISHITSKVGAKNKVQLFGVSDDDVASYQWYVNDELLETLQNPTFFLDNQAYEIVAEIITLSGCKSSDTLILNFSDPLSAKEENNFFIFPNPTNGKVEIVSEGEIDELKVFSLDGKEIWSIASPSKYLDLSSLQKGTYVIKIFKGDASFQQQVLIE